MTETKLARVLEQNCPQLEHIQGTVQRTLEFEQRTISPASLMDMFDSQNGIPCYHVTFSEDHIAEKRKVGVELEIENLKKQCLELETIRTSKKTKLDNELFETDEDKHQKDFIEQMVNIGNLTNPATFEQYLIKGQDICSSAFYQNICTMQAVGKVLSINWVLINYPLKIVNDAKALNIITHSRHNNHTIAVVNVY